MKVIFQTVIFFSFLVSCNRSTQPEKSDLIKEKIKKGATSFPSRSMRSVFSPDTCLKPFYRMPDSLLTQEEIQLKRRYLHLLYIYLSVEDNQYVFHLSKDSFLKEGIPAIYYDELLYSLQETNKWVKQMHIDSLPNLFERAKSEIKKQLEPNKDIS